MLLCLGKQNLSDNEDVTDGSPSLLSKVFPSINDFSAGDLHTPELLGEQTVPLQGIYHEFLDLKNQAFQNFEEEIVLHGSNDANLDVASADDFDFDRVF